MKDLYLLIIGVAGFVGCTPENHRPSAAEGVASVENVDFTITNLYDAFGKEQAGLTKDFGFSALIRYRGKSILFDAGTNADILKSNVEALGIDLTEVDYAVGSHVHGDHINGFDYLLEVNPEVKIYLPFDFYAGADINFNITGSESAIADSLPDEMKYFGGKSDLAITIIQSGRFWGADVTYVTENLEFGDGAKLIFTRSPYLGYGSKYPSVEEVRGMGDSDVSPEAKINFAGLPELSLSLAASKGEVLMVGCSHSSVQNIVADTRAFTGEPVHLVYGGYHMLPYGRDEINTVVSRLKNELGVARIAPAHCTGHLAFKLLMDAYGENYIFAGLGSTIRISSDEQGI